MHAVPYNTRLGGSRPQFVTQMKRPDRQLIGILLVVAVIVFAVFFQWLGPGFVITDHPTTPPEVAAQGIVLTERRTTHPVLIPLIILGVVGFVLSMMPKRDRTNAA